jgi:hypothetical protein
MPESLDCGHGELCGDDGTVCAIGRDGRMLTYDAYCIKWRDTMNIHLSLTPLISLIAGVLILVMPKLLNYIVAIYLIAVGLIGIFGLSAMQFR